MIFDVNLPRDIKNIIDFNFVLLMVYAVFYMTSVNGIVTINFIDGYSTTYNLDLSVSSQPCSLEPLRKGLETYRSSLVTQRDRLLLWNYYIFYAIIPFLNIFYGFWCIKKGYMVSPKNLYTLIISKFRGV